MLRHRAFTLVEMLVALGLGSLVTVGVVELLAGNQHSHAVLTGHARMQESARHALDFLARSARAAGYLGCARSVPRNTLNGALGGLFEVDIETGVAGFDGTGRRASPDGWTPSLDALPRRKGRRSVNAFRNRNGIDVAALRPGSDVLVFRFVDVPVRLTAPVGPDDDHVPVRSTRSGPDRDDFAVIADCAGAALFRATAVQTLGDGVALARGPGGGPYDNAATASLVPPDTAFGNDLGPAGAAVGRVMTHIYYVAAGAGANNRGVAPWSLWRKSGTARPAELVQGIEDLQVLFGVDGDGDGVPNRYAPPRTGPGPPIRAVRIAVTANGVDVVPGESTIRRTFVRTVAVRNG
ncbi:MAG: prepilin-type N-terminal cleavage/methylation domain-containing protein [Gammaproteobacteria bacterium]|nr:prepilin-type N-terminal cleavage/methylation domain-containing protein [Gammaproteobacteria bacterium]